MRYIGRAKENAKKNHTQKQNKTKKNSIEGESF